MLPQADATDLLRTKFGQWSGEIVLERWVDYAVGIEKRETCLGHAAIELAIKTLKVDLRYDKELVYDGELRLVDGRKIIFLREAIESSRVNFTIAHELGHAALFQLDSSLEQTNQEVERLCNSFAAELLLPSACVRSVPRDSSYARAVAILSAKSGASLPATCIRMTECFGGAAGIASKDGRILNEYGKVPRSLKLSEFLSRIASDRNGVFCSHQVSSEWILDTGFVHGKYVYVLRTPNQSCSV